MLLLSARFALASSLLLLAACELLGEDPGGCERWVLQDQVTNARDLGGHPAEGAEVACGKIMRGGDLGAVAGEGCDQFQDLGVRAVVDLRAAAVQASDPPPACVSDQASLNDAHMPKLPPTTATHVALIDPAQP